MHHHPGVCWILGNALKTLPNCDMIWWWKESKHPSCVNQSVNMKFQRQGCVIQTDRQRSLWLRAEEDTHLLPSSPLSSCLSSPISSSLHFFSFLSSPLLLSTVMLTPVLSFLSQLVSSSVLSCVISITFLKEINCNFSMFIKTKSISHMVTFSNFTTKALGSKDGWINSSALFLSSPLL